MDTSGMPALPAPSPVESPVAETMRKVQNELRAGLTPSFEALLVFGEPTAR